MTTDAYLDIGRACLARQVRMLSRAVTALYDEELRAHGLKASQMNVLVAISILGDAAPGELSRRLCLEKSTLSRNAERMAARGWIKAVEGPDGRGVRYRLTAAGVRLLDRVRPDWERAQAAAASLLGPNGITALRKAMETIDAPR